MLCLQPGRGERGGRVLGSGDQPAGPDTPRVPKALQRVPWTRSPCLHAYPNPQPPRTTLKWGPSPGSLGSPMPPAPPRSGFLEGWLLPSRAEPWAAVPRIQPLCPQAPGGPREALKTGSPCGPSSLDPKWGCLWGRARTPSTSRPQRRASRLSREERPRAGLCPAGTRHWGSGSKAHPRPLGLPPALASHPPSRSSPRPSPPHLLLP